MATHDMMHTCIQSLCGIMHLAHFLFIVLTVFQKSVCSPVAVPSCCPVSGSSCQKDTEGADMSGLPPAHDVAANTAQAPPSQSPLQIQRFHEPNTIPILDSYLYSACNGQPVSHEYARSS